MRMKDMKKKNATVKQMFHVVSVHFDMKLTGDNGK